ncbi:hypothetical protein J2X34_005683 [Rhodococcus sp. BE178]
MTPPECEEPRHDEPSGAPENELEHAHIIGLDTPAFPRIGRIREERAEAAASASMSTLDHLDK